MAEPDTHPVGDNVFLQRAYKLSTTEEARNLYDEWASQYDKDLQNEDYAAPKLAAESLILARGDIVQDGSQQLSAVKIMDAGCGTGLVGVSLARFGARNIEGLDISPGMLDIARHTGVYGVLEEADLSKPIARLDNSFDAVMCVGTLTRGHVGPNVLKEFVRIVKPEGLIVATVLDDIWEQDGFRTEVNNMRDSGQVSALRADVIGLRTTSDVGGRLLVLKKL
ncbi:hypothetical protein LTR99_004479 [Exophiala xenobiotica]|uniref:Methyltransferase type 11 domain-containing protein n=1 Tax=Vermiconidia calcicola TaxID=1690605 RepID=A0AAV9QAW6_9PEZI|nr:hypothetical protein LTR92_000225 [Exophiala xenobiotica]KAK5539759.1 hypothetical protein LTR25_003464 [Vermiconidia calcicola]KAK5541729.1 hypothetical protein LTR23_005580 [Chaetothyriales sp. CCFEE 6169]KAK5274811.1 hypothetical protein LTR96_001412 [Exophiala xenobiotica]KAK5304023.1 hypothetical protein LTR99_004479 [Exophiala xenobiotica]